MTMPEKDPKDLDIVPPEPIEEVESDEKKQSHESTTQRSRLFPFIQNIQRYSSYTFSAFLTLHAASVVAGPIISPEIGDYTMNFTGAVYQEQLIEPFLVYGSLAAHIASGLILRLRYSYLYYRTHDKLPPRPSNVALCGYGLIPLVGGHLLYTRWIPLRVLGDSSMISMEYVAHTLHKYPIVGSMVLLTLLGTTAYHVINGWRRWLGLYTTKSNAKAYFTVLGSVLAGAISLFRIYNMAESSGWMAKQFDSVLTVLYM